MRICNECQVHVANDVHHCPLCGALLQKGDNAACKPINRYPDLSKMDAQYNLIYRIALFVSLLAIIVSVIVNLLVSPGFLWCLITVAAVIYFWIVFPPLVRRGADFAKQTVITVLFTSILVIAIDFITGYRGWALNYVVPSLCIGGTGVICLMVILNRTNWAQLVLYQVLVGVFGLVPLILYLFNLGSSLILVIICAAVSVASLLAAAIFGDKTIKSEFIRRFHF